MAQVPCSSNEKEKSPSYGCRINCIGDSAHVAGIGILTQGSSPLGVMYVQV